MKLFFLTKRCMIIIGQSTKELTVDVIVFVSRARVSARSMRVLPHSRRVCARPRLTTKNKSPCGTLFFHLTRMSSDVASRARFSARVSLFRCVIFRPSKFSHCFKKTKPWVRAFVRSEIVHIQGGQCGNQIGAKFWEVSAVAEIRTSRRATFSPRF